MVRVENRSKVILTETQKIAIEKATEELELAFGRKVYAVFVREDKKQLTDLFGICFTFDYRKK